MPARRQPSSARDWKAIVIEADPDFPTKRNYSPSYEFSNDRDFSVKEVPGRAYGWVGTGS